MKVRHIRHLGQYLEYNCSVCLWWFLLLPDLNLVSSAALTWWGTSSGVATRSVAFLLQLWHLAVGRWVLPGQRHILLLVKCPVCVGGGCGVVVDVKLGDGDHLVSLVTGTAFLGDLLAMEGLGEAAVQLWGACESFWRSYRPPNCMLLSHGRPVPSPQIWSQIPTSSCCLWPIVFLLKHLSCLIPTN